MSNPYSMFHKTVTHVQDSVDLVPTTDKVVSDNKITSIVERPHKARWFVLALIVILNVVVAVVAFSTANMFPVESSAAIVVPMIIVSILVFVQFSSKNASVIRVSREAPSPSPVQQSDTLVPSDGEVVSNGKCTNIYTIPKITSLLIGILKAIFLCVVVIVTLGLFGEFIGEVIAMIVAAVLFPGLSGM